MPVFKKHVSKVYQRSQVEGCNHNSCGQLAAIFLAKYFPCNLYDDHRQQKSNLPQEQPSNGSKNKTKYKFNSFHVDGRFWPRLAMVRREASKVSHTNLRHMPELRYTTPVSHRKRLTGFGSLKLKAVMSRSCIGKRGFFTSVHQTSTVFIMDMVHQRYVHDGHTFRATVAATMP